MYYIPITAEMIQRCTKCKEEYLPYGLTSLNGEFVCNDCLYDFCQEEAVVQNYLPGFLEAKWKEYLVYWFSGGDPNNDKFLMDGPILKEPEKIDILSAAYKRWRPWHIKDAEALERDFISSVPGEWEDYLRSC